MTILVKSRFTVFEVYGVFELYKLHHFNILGQKLMSLQN